MILRSILFVFLYSLLSQFLLAQPKQPIVIRIATVVPEGSSWVKCLKNIDQDCRKIGIQFILYAGGTAGENQAMVQKIKGGQLDGAGLAAAALGEFSPRLRIMEIPYMYRSLDEWKFVFKDIRSEVEADLEKANYIVMGWAYAGFAYIYSYSPIRTIADFRKSKPWIYPGDPLMEDGFRELQASGVALGSSGVLPALQNGMVQCVYNSPYGLLAMQWHTNVKYWTDSPIENPIGAVIITKKAYERIPLQYRSVFREICRKHFFNLAAQINQDNEDAFKELEQKYNIQKVTPDEEWLREFEQFGKRIAERQIGKLYSKEFLQRVVEIQEKFRSKKN